MGIRLFQKNRYCFFTTRLNTIMQPRLTNIVLRMTIPVSTLTGHSPHMSEHTNNDCIFCKIVAREIPSQIVFEDADVMIFLDAFPIAKGHALLIPKKHTNRFEAVDDDEASLLGSRLRFFAPKLMAALGADGFNLGLNNGSAAGQVVDHVHWHI